MTKQEILVLVKSYIDQSLSGQEIEMIKFDCKTKWYDLKSDKGINEFIKDASAIANSFGPDGFIVIGYNEKFKTFQDSRFADSGLRDVSDIVGIINKRVDRLFQFDVIDDTIDNHNLSIIHIPPSFDKPHVIRNYQTFDKNGIKKDEQNRIFVRKSTTSHYATKEDLELMFWDRKNIVPDYEISCSFHKSSFHSNPSSSGDILLNLEITINLIFENLGRRPVAITDIKLDLSLFQDPSTHEWLKLRSYDTFHKKPIVIDSDKMVNSEINFTCPELLSKKSLSYAKEKLDEFENYLDRLAIKKTTIRLSNGTQFNCNLQIIS